MKTILPLFLSFLLIQPALAQEEGNPDYVEYEKKKEEAKKEKESELDGYSFAERCYWGGNLAGSLGTYGNYLEISPIFGYNLSPRLSAGIGLTYKYFSGINPYYGVSYSTSVYGGSIFARYLLGNSFLLQGELETLNTEAWNDLKQKFERKFIPVACAGIGYRGDMGYNSYSYFLLMYDFIQDRDSPYPFSPLIIKIGMVFPIKSPE